MILSRIYPSGYALLNELNGTIIKVEIQRLLKDLPTQRSSQHTKTPSSKYVVVPSVPSSSLSNSTNAKIKMQKKINVCTQHVLNNLLPSHTYTICWCATLYSSFQLLLQLLLLQCVQHMPSNITQRKGTGNVKDVRYEHKIKSVTRIHTFLIQYSKTKRAYTLVSFPFDH